MTLKKLHLKGTIEANLKTNREVIVGQKPLYTYALPGLETIDFKAHDELV